MILNAFRMLYKFATCLACAAIFDVRCGRIMSVYVVEINPQNTSDDRKVPFHLDQDILGYATL